MKILKVKIEYETIEPVILTVSDAIKHNSRFDQTFKIENGDVEKGFEQADHVLDGTFTIGGQEQFYFETQVRFQVDDFKLALPLALMFCPVFDWRRALSYQHQFENY